MTVSDIYNFICTVAPFSDAMDFDNCGILVGNKDDKVSKVLLSLDITKEVAEEAKDIGADLIISHHPVIFSGMKRLDSLSIPYLLAKYNIAAICAHTNLDMAKEGVNYHLAKRLLLENLEPLSVYKSNEFYELIVFVPSDYSEVVTTAMVDAGAGSIGNYEDCSFLCDGISRFKPLKSAHPFMSTIGKYESVHEKRIEVLCSPYKLDAVLGAMRKVHPYEEPAYGIYKTSSVKDDVPLGLIGELVEPMESKEFAKHVKRSLGCEGLRYTQLHKNIHKVAVCSGSAGNLITDVIKKGADAFVTGEIKHHEILLANEKNIMVVDAGHYKTEDVIIEPLMQLLIREFTSVSFSKTGVFDDNIRYI